MKSTKKFFAALATTIFSGLTNASYMKCDTMAMMPDSSGGGSDTGDGSGGGPINPPIGH